ncbi:MAG: hypothetical protein ACUVWO_17620 [Thermodesulfobacteriota bacterium]
MTEPRSLTQDEAVFGADKAMNLIEALKKAVRMEVRATSRGKEYLEAVIGMEDLEALHSFLERELAPAAKKPGQEVSFPKKIQKLVDSLGGLRIEQSFFYKEDGKQVVYAALWPWRSDPNKITLKSGVVETV